MPFSLTGGVNSISDEYITSIQGKNEGGGVSKFELKMMYNELCTLLLKW
jgi:hypothetical protein